MTFGLNRPRDEAGSATTAIFIGLFVAFGGILFGYDTGTIGGILAMKFWLREFSTGYTEKGQPAITSSETALIVSILSAGTFIGSLFSAPLGDFIGRKWGLIASCIVFNFGVILQTVAEAIPLFTAGRFFAGFGVGLISALVPLYQSETAPKWIRGAIVGSYQWAITIGLFLAAMVNYATQERMDTGSYRIPIAIQLLWALILIAGMLVLPETPRYHIRCGRVEAAYDSLSRLRRLPTTHPGVIAEIEEIQANHEFELSLGASTYLECFKGNLGKRLLTGCVLQATQQLSGINFIFYYGTSFFTEKGLASPFVTTVITNVVNVCSTVPGLWGIERFGRRSLLLWGAVGMMVCQFIVAGIGSSVDNESANRAFVAFICLYIAFFASTWGPIAWVVTGEIFPLKARAKCLSMTTATNWLVNWAIAFATPHLVKAGPGNANLQSNVFYIWGGACVICVVFVYFMVYETKGLSLEEVDELYLTVKRARKSTDFVPTHNFRDNAKAGGEHVEMKNQGSGENAQELDV